MQLRKINNIIIDEHDQTVADFSINPLLDPEYRKQIEAAIQKALALYNDHAICKHVNNQ